MHDDWEPIDNVAQNVVVDTAIIDANGVRNVQPLKRLGPLWYVPDGSMYVYYTPTHWRARAETAHEA